MAKRGIRISTKLIGVSTLLVVLVIGVFGAINSLQSRRIIDDSVTRLRERITEAIRQAGKAQMATLAETARIAAISNDWGSVNDMLPEIGRRDQRISLVVVVEPAQKGRLVVASDHKVDIDNIDKKPEYLKEPLAGIVAKGVTNGLILPAERTMVFAAPVYLNKEEKEEKYRVALVYSLRAMDMELKKAEQMKRTEVGRSLRNTLLVGVFSVLLGLLMAVLQGLSISRPIQAVVRQVNQIAGGDLQARVEVKSGDEIGLLGDRFNYMAEQVLVLMRETSRKATMEKELEVASAIQSTLVPDSNLAKLEGLSLAGYFKPATQCGGDWWTYYTMADGRVLIIIGDVTGHGVASAMITAAAKGAATTMITVGHNKVELRDLLIAMNAAIHDAAKGRFVMTCFASIYDPKTHVLTFANAGHNFPYLYEASTTNLMALVVRGNRLGDLMSSDYEIKQIKVNPGDTLVWYTDGIVECEDVRGEEFGERRFRGLLRKFGNLEPDKVRDEILVRANQFFGGVPQKDDITLVVGRFS